MTYTEFTCDPVNGSNLNAGSTNSAPAYSGVGDSDGTSVFTPSDGSTPASTVSVGMFASIYVTAGATVAVFVGRITAVAAGVNGAITVSTTAKSGTIPTNSAGAHTITCKVGGYWKGPNGAVAFPFGFITAGLTDSSGDYPRVTLLNTATYSIAAGLTHNIAGPIYFQGAASTPGDLGRAIIDGGTSGAGYNLFVNGGGSGTQLYFRDLIFQNNGATGLASGFKLSGARCVAERVTAHAVRGTGIELNSASKAVECEAYACNQSNTANVSAINLTSSGALAERCLSHSNTGSNNANYGATSSGVQLTDCISDGSTFSFQTNNANIVVLLERFTAYNPSSDALHIPSGNCVITADNCILSSVGGAGVNNSGTGNIVRLINTSYFSTTSGHTSGVVDETGAITCSVQPLNDPANGDFSLNNTPVGGASVRNAGRGKFTQDAGSYNKTTTAFPDGGAVQHQDAGGGSGGTPVLQSAIIQGLGAI